MSRTQRPRAQQLRSTAARTLYAAIRELDAASQRDLLEAISDHLALAALGVNHTTSSRVRRAVTALRDVADACGDTPSIGDYRRIRKDRPELDLPPDGSLRRWLGAGSWNDCLRMAHLNNVEEGEVVRYSLGPSLTADELLTAIRACAGELGGRPSLSRYVSWARRHDVRSRHERLPTTGDPFTRVFGTWSNAATIALDTHPASDDDDTAAYACVSNGKLMPLKGSYEPSDYESAIREVTARLGREPSVAAYKAERQKIQYEALQAGRPRVIPSTWSIYNGYPSWSVALEQARQTPDTEAAA